LSDFSEFVRIWSHRGFCFDLTFSSSRRGGDQNKFETLTLEKFVGISGQGFDFQPASRLCVNQEQQRQSRVRVCFDFHFRFGLSSAIKTTTTTTFEEKSL
jgi:hypothetical protein